MGEVTISLLNLQMAMVPVWSISFWERVETRASSAASFTTSTRTFPGGRMAQVLLQRRALRLERLQRVGGQDRVLTLRVEKDEVLALDALVVTGDGQGVPREAQVAPRPVLHPGQLEGGDRVGIAPLAEGHPPGEEVEGLVLLAAPGWRRSSSAWAAT